jgi:hypothetical protein
VPLHPLPELMEVNHLELDVPVRQKKNHASLAAKAINLLKRTVCASASAGRVPRRALPESAGETGYSPHTM